MNTETSLLNIKQEDIITDLVNDSQPSSYHKVTRRMKIISEWKGGRHILVDMPEGFELRRQGWGGGFVKEGWHTNASFSLSECDITNMKIIIDNWNK